MSRWYATIHNVYGDESFLTTSDNRPWGSPGGVRWNRRKEAQEPRGVTLGDAWGFTWGLLGTQGLDVVCHRGRDRKSVV